MPKIKALIGIINYNYVHGGGEQYCLNLIKSLKSRYAFEILAGKGIFVNPNPITTQIYVHNVPFLYILRILGEKGTTFFHKMIRTLHILVYIVSATIYLMIKFNDFSVHVANDMPSYAAMKLARLFARSKKKIVCVVHGMIGKLETRVYSKEDKIICVNNLIADKVRRWSGADVHVIHPGYDPTIFYAMNKLTARKKINFPLKSNLFLYVGRLVPIKNLETLVAAFIADSLKSNGYLYLVGDGVLMNDLQRIVARGRVSGKVVFTGNVSQDQIRLFYNASDLVIIPSWSEAFNTVAIEALACGANVAVSSGAEATVQAFGDWVTVFNPGSVENLAKILSNIPNRATRRERINCVRNYTWNRSGKLFQKILT